MTSDTLSLVTPIEIQCPPVLRFGGGLAPSVGDYARKQGLSRALVVADGFNAGRVERLGLPGTPAVFGRVKPEPDIPNLQALLDMAETAMPDLVIGFGGGSAMDLAKLAAVLAGSSQVIHEVVGPEKVRARNIALVQVP